MKPVWLVSFDESGSLSNDELNYSLSEYRCIDNVWKFRSKAWNYFNRHNSKKEGHPQHCSLCLMRYNKRNH